MFTSYPLLGALCLLTHAGGALLCLACSCLCNLPLTLWRFWKQLFPFTPSLWWISQPPNLPPLLSCHNCLWIRTFPPGGTSILLDACEQVQAPSKHPSQLSPSSNSCSPMYCHHPTCSPVVQFIIGTGSILSSGVLPRKQMPDPQRLQRQMIQSDSYQDPSNDIINIHNSI